MTKTYKLRYSHLFYQDLDSITDYILLVLKNPGAAQKLIHSVEMAIKKRLNNPVAAAIYPSMQTRKNPYRHIAVGNYLIFYVVIGDTMIIRRMLYGKRNIAGELG